MCNLLSQIVTYAALKTPFSFSFAISPSLTTFPSLARSGRNMLPLRLSGSLLLPWSEVLGCRFACADCGSLFLWWLCRCGCRCCLDTDNWETSVIERVDKCLGRVGEVWIDRGAGLVVSGEGLDIFRKEGRLIWSMEFILESCRTWSRSYTAAVQPRVQNHVQENWKLNVWGWAMSWTRKWLNLHIKFKIECLKVSRSLPAFSL